MIRWEVAVVIGGVTITFPFSSREAAIGFAVLVGLALLTGLI
jgi:hypothetical protein